MPADEYASVGGGGTLKLKGGKVQKTKKKKKSKAQAIERALSTEDDSTSKEVERTPRDDGKDGEEGDVAEHKTEAERRHEEANRKKVRGLHSKVDEPLLTSTRC